MDNALRAIGQKISSLGSPDPRLNVNNQVDIRIRWQLKLYAKKDPPPQRVLPIPVEIIQHAVSIVYQDPHSSYTLQATAELITIGFFFLMRNGEYCQTSDKDGHHPFCFKDVALYNGTAQLNTLTASKDELLSATQATIHFNQQKNSN